MARAMMTPNPDTSFRATLLAPVRTSRLRRSEMTAPKPRPVSSLVRPVFHFTETRVRGHIAICVLAAVIEQLIGNRLADADLRDPDLDEQHLSADRAIQELDRIRQVTFTAGEQTITAVTRRTGLQQQILTALQVDTAAWTRPIIAG
jgi:hypothetical protein